MSLFLSDYMNQNGVSDVMNPNYKYPGPPRSVLPTISSDDTESEYLNCFKNGTIEPEYLNELPSSSSFPFTPNNVVQNMQKYAPQNSIDNPDYQQDFTPTFKTHTNGHIPAAENTEYLGPDWRRSSHELRDCSAPLKKGHWCCCENMVMRYHFLFYMLHPALQSQVTLYAASCVAHTPSHPHHSKESSPSTKWKTGLETATDPAQLTWDFLYSICVFHKHCQ